MFSVTVCVCGGESPAASGQIQITQISANVLMLNVLHVSLLGHLLCSGHSASLPTPADHVERVRSGPGTRRRRRPRLGRLGRTQAETRLQPRDLYPSAVRAAAKKHRLKCQLMHADEYVPFFLFNNVTDGCMFEHLC